MRPRSSNCLPVAQIEELHWKVFLILSWKQLALKRMIWMDSSCLLRNVTSKGARACLCTVVCLTRCWWPAKVLRHFCGDNIYVTLPPLTGHLLSLSSMVVLMGLLCQPSAWVSVVLKEMTQEVVVRVACHNCFSEGKERLGDTSSLLSSRGDQRKWQRPMGELPKSHWRDSFSFFVN